jgi:ABC-type nitrate/sulfonate/bicarbonate transport system substrate-binding protein
MRRLFRLLILIGGLTVASGALAQGAMKLKVVFATPPTTYALPHFVAQDLGWLKSRGLEVEEVFLTGDANALRALLSGQGDLAAPGTFPAYSVVAEGGRIKAIGSWQPLVDYVMIARQGITSLKELTNARIAAASIGGLTTELPKMLLQKHRIDTSRAVFFSVGGHEARLQAVVGGKADAALVGILYAGHGKRLAKLNVVANLAQEFPGLGYSYLVVNEKDLANPEKRRAFETYVRGAVVEASRFIMKEPDRAAEVLHKRMPDVPLDLMKEVVRALNDAKVWGVNGGIDPEVTNFTAPLAATLKSASREIKAQELLDRSIVERILAELGRV